MKPPRPWHTIAERVLVHSPVLDFIERDLKKASGSDDTVHRFYLMRSRDWCNIIPVTEDAKVVFVRQYRIGIDETTLEIPGGVVDATDPSIEAGALREMTEETGYEALPGSTVEYLGWSHPNPATQNNRVHSFIVGPVRLLKKQKLGPAEMIEVVEIPIEEIPERIQRGEISHALMLNTFFHLALRKPEVAEALRDALRASAPSSRA